MKSMMSRVAIALGLIVGVMVVNVAEAQDASVDATVGVTAPRLPPKPLPIPGPRVPEIDPSLSRAMVILLLSGVLIFTDRRQRT